jgi:hypothetical protein
MLNSSCCPAILNNHSPKEVGDLGGANESRGAFRPCTPFNFSLSHRKEKLQKKAVPCGLFAAYFSAASQTRPAQAGLKQARPTTPEKYSTHNQPKGVNVNFFTP